jgi:glutamine cyclotransferase
MSDGSASLRFVDPGTFAQRRRIVVTDAGRPITSLNELEYVRGEIFANVWQTESIVRIAPDSGQVRGWIDLHGLLSPGEQRGIDVLNGIAYDAEHDRLFVTGKLWPRLFEIRVR